MPIAHVFYKGYMQSAVGTQRGINKNGTNWSKCQRRSRGDASLDQARAVCSLIRGLLAQNKRPDWIRLEAIKTKAHLRISK